MGSAGRAAPVAAVAVVVVIASVALAVRLGQAQPPPPPGDIPAAAEVVTATPDEAPEPTVETSAAATLVASPVTSPTAATVTATSAPAPSSEPHAFVRFVNHDPDYPVVFRAGDLTVGPLPPWTVTEFHVVGHWTPVSMTVPGHPECTDSASSTSEGPAGHWVVAAEPLHGQVDCRGELIITADDPVGVGLSHPSRWSRSDPGPAPGDAPTGAQPSSTTSTPGS